MSYRCKDREDERKDSLNHRCRYISPVFLFAECDSVYEDTDCHDGCVLASPGYPGLYPPNIRCRYLITSGPRISIAINFTAVLLPYKVGQLLLVLASSAKPLRGAHACV
ncbi:hypothetical protein HN011_009358 [Eciton burchellii]|nr:hypothetical protein HN011_009358 [Eciton burchellii]